MNEQMRQFFMVLLMLCIAIVMVGFAGNWLDTNYSEFEIETEAAT